MNSKLQLYITMSQKEFKDMVQINQDSYVQSWVCDLRDAVADIDYDTHAMSIFYMIKYIDTGFFIVVLRTIPPTAGHHLASWVYVPYSLRITPREIADAVSYVTSKISGSEVTGSDIKEMRETFARDYETDLLAPIFPPQEGLSYAWRYYGGRTGLSLTDLIGKHRFQTAYLPYAGTLLIDSRLSSSVAGTDLTSAPIEEMATLLPPDAKTDTGGYKPYIYNQDFDVPFYAPMSQPVEIVWRKEGSPDIRQSVTVMQHEMRAPSIASPRHATPAPEPAPAPAPTPAPAHETMVSDVPNRKKTYRFQIPAKSAAIGTVIEFEITTSAELADSPIDGYEPTSAIQEGAGRSNHLLYIANGPHRKFIDKAIFALAGFVAGLLCAWVVTCSRQPDAEPATTEEVVVAEATTEQPQATTDTQATATQATAGTAEEQPAPDRSFEAAIRYLDTNKTWEKSEMEAFPDLQGLYADMNKIDRHRLVDVWGPKLKDSRAFTNQIVHHCKLSYKKKARTKGGRATYNDPTETKILVQAYLNTIDP